ncbi:MAG TPA: C45 family peptidase [Terriglobia bacterium]|nr:C45 family peptidase [Terriglobia bacterium]
MKRRDFNRNLLRIGGAGGLLGLTGEGWNAAPALAALAGRGSAPVPVPASPDPRLKGAYRFSRGLWVYVHLQGSPSEIGFQHGYLLAPEIADGFKAVSLTNLHGTGKDQDFFRRTAREMIWPRVDREYQEEIEGIHLGLLARGIPMELDDVIWLNAMEELADYYVPWYDKQHKVAEARPITSPGNCSAFVATGSYTTDHQIVMAHNAWTSYLHGERWNIIFDIVPQRGYRMLMDGYPGVIASDDDFGINSDGLMITETTITQFHGWNPEGNPEFVRARKAMQYASSIDEYVQIMVKENNGGYANDWLLGDRKTGEIAQFELGLKAWRVWRSKDGYFVGSNFVSDPKVLAEDTTFNPHDLSLSPNARRVRWEQLMKQYKGKIDSNRAQQFLSDHYDTFDKKHQPGFRTLCGHGDLVPYRETDFETGPFDPLGAVQGKVTDSRMTEAMRFVARRGHPCGGDFYAAPFLKAHPEYAWQSPLLHDMIAGPWTEFKTDDKA